MILLAIQMCKHGCQMKQYVTLQSGIMEITHLKLKTKSINTIKIQRDIITKTFIPFNLHRVTHT